MTHSVYNAYQKSSTTYIWFVCSMSSWDFSRQNIEVLLRRAGANKILRIISRLSDDHTIPASAQSFLRSRRMEGSGRERKERYWTGKQKRGRDAQITFGSDRKSPGLQMTGKVKMAQMAEVAHNSSGELSLGVFMYRTTMMLLELKRIGDVSTCMFCPSVIVDPYSRRL